MSKQTSSDLKKIEQDIKSFEKYWGINKKTLEIKHVPLNFWSKIIDLFWRKRHKVADLYWWSSHKWANLEMITHETAIKHDEIHIKGFPRKYQMINSWAIPSKDLKYLYDGPLIDESGNILVKYQSKVQKIISLISQFRPLGWLIRPLSWLIQSIIS